MDKNYSEKARENALFHYTNAKGLKGIIETNSIWATAHHCSNDLSEFRVAQELIVQSIFSALELDFKFFRRGMIDRSIRKAIDHALLEIKTFVTSFCIAENKTVFNEGLLSQWRSYGTDGGYAIIVDKKKLIKELVKAEITGVLSPVNYHPETNSLLNDFLGNYIEEVIKPSIEEIRKLPIKEELQEFRPKENLRVTIDHKNISLVKRHRKFINSLTVIEENQLNERYYQFLNLITLTKSTHFHEENEYRLTYYLKGRKDIYHSFEKNGLIVPYVRPEFDFLSCVERIIIGPSSRIDDRQKSLETLLEFRGGKNIKIVQSTIPYDKG